MSIEGSELLTLRPEYPRMADYFGLWSMEERAFNGLFSLVAGTDLVAHVEMSAERMKGLQARMGRADESKAEAPYRLTSGGIALINVQGTLMKAQSSFSSATSTVQLRQAIRQAGRDAAVNGVCFLVDSPGGTVAGTHDVSAELAALEKIKPTGAFIEDLGASAAYWFASQAGLVATNPTGLVGSIGTYMTVCDYSAAAEEMKIKIHVVRAGEFKGAGVAGTKITDEQLASWQEMVNGLNDQFISAVASGRRMSVEAVRKLADGRVHVGEAAKSIGLVDAVQGLDETIRQLQERAGVRSSSKKGAKMTEQTTTLTGSLQSTAATLDELTAHLPGADDSFVMKQLRGKVTLDQAKSNWLTELNSRLAASKAETAAAKAESEAASKKTGVPALGTKSKGAQSEDDTIENPISEFNALVAGNQRAGLSRSEAVLSAAKENPALHQAFLLATNKTKQSRRLIGEKYEQADE
ncbi:S49 family peptidase [Schlesneria sp.]|uniref:S49 family peptidase n=1 Tax=Schlesneria sp. TaxID=2762018 RepID=UPI002F0ECA6E